MGFLPFGKGQAGKDSIGDDSSSLTSLSTADADSSIPRTTIEADGVKEKKVAEASGVNGGGLEGKDVIDCRTRSRKKTTSFSRIKCFVRRRRFERESSRGSSTSRKAEKSDRFGAVVVKDEERSGEI